MSIRITTSVEEGKAIVHIAGQLEGETVDALADEVEHSQVPEFVDLTELQSADSEGVRLILKLVSLGSQIRGASPYIRLLLQQKEKNA